MMEEQVSKAKKMPPLQKRTVAVLTEAEMTSINGGSSFICLGYYAAVSSEGCAVVAVGAIMYIYDKVSG